MPPRTSLRARVRCALTLAIVAMPAALAATAHATALPGRVLIAADRGAVAADVDGGYLTAALALPNGGAVLAGGMFTAPNLLVQMLPNGAPDPAFGADGVARLAGPASARTAQVLRQSDGKLLVVSSLDTGGSQFTVSRLNANGTPDTTYGTEGIVKTRLYIDCDCGSAALTPSGELLLTGATAGGRPAVEELTQSGAADSAWGHGGLATIGATEDAVTVDALPGGDVLVLGSSGSRSVGFLTRLTAQGTEDPSFAGGAPITVAPNWGKMVAEPDGAVMLLDSSGTTLKRYTSAGVLDTTFATNGVADVPLAPNIADNSPAMTELLPGPGQDVLVANWRQGLTGLDQEQRTALLDVVPIGSSTGKLDTRIGRTSVTVPFGGGASTWAGAGPVPSLAPALAQDSFAGILLPRPDGSYLTVGTVGVAQPLGEGDGWSVYDFAAAAFTPTFAPETNFGGTSPAPRLTLRVPAQQARADLRTRSLSLAITASTVGLCGVAVNGGGKLLARSVVPFLKAGARQNVQVLLTPAGMKLLRSGRSVRISVRGTMRDLLTDTATAAAAGVI